MAAYTDPIRRKRFRDDQYQNFVSVGDTFDISNLNLRDGPFETFSYKGSGRYLIATSTIYGGADPSNLLVQIGDLAGWGKTPIRILTLTGHTAPMAITGDDENGSTLENRYIIAVSYARAREKNGPQRCWFTRNALVRVLGCYSVFFVQNFAKEFLRAGAVGLGTNIWICGNCMYTDDKGANKTCPGGDEKTDYPAGHVWIVWPQEFTGDLSEMCKVMPQTYFQTKWGMNAAPGVWESVNGRL